ncbi:hypothetical protein Sant_3032 [Sodalis praecaptivus]|uniref:Uncharacterized protein n=1 Tax=Sodalis praecaptivus TaxID=1239307 RepID=W0I0S9_9GAMM|nr:hypothetical protein Sant_3032 [Sodalis praecaptivus]
MSACHPYVSRPLCLLTSPALRGGAGWSVRPVISPTLRRMAGSPPSRIALSVDKGNRARHHLLPRRTQCPRNDPTSRRCRRR